MQHPELNGLNGWIEWKGGPCPVPPGTPIEVFHRNGERHEEPARTRFSESWGHLGGGGDIVAYRVTVPTPTNPLTQQVGGGHYKDMAIQPVEFIHANGIGYFEGNVIKYVSRWRKKNGIADLEKARHYINLLIELENRDD